MANSLAPLPVERLRALESGYAEAVAAKRRQILLGAALLAAAFLWSAYVAEVDLGTFFRHIDRLTSYIGRLFILDAGDHAGSVVFAHPAEWMWGLGRWLELLGVTLLIAYLGTILGGIGAFFLCFLAAGNLGNSAWVRFTTKRFLEICRTVPELVFALIFVLAFGLGPLAGVLALAIHSAGALGKLFSEVVENIDQRPLEGTIASGARWTQMVRYAVLPQVLSNFASYGLLRFEVNVRGAAVMGFVGAGGIGQNLIEAIRKFYYADVSAILVLIVVTVFVIDLLTERLRHHLLGLDHQ